MNTNARVILLSGLALPLIAALGGWATISVKNLPDYLLAGQATSLAFTVRQHGGEPLRGLHPTIEARSNGGRAVTVPATAAGHEYAGVLTLTEPGDWTITINSNFGKSRITLLPIRVVAAAGQRPLTLSDAQRGERLFVAKGCTTCHVEMTVGPKLSGRRFDADWLKRWLADPQATRSGAQMPNPNLNASEIAALTAYLNNQTAQGS